MTLILVSALASVLVLQPHYHSIWTLLCPRGQRTARESESAFGLISVTVSWCLIHQYINNASRLFLLNWLQLQLAEEFMSLAASNPIQSTAESPVIPSFQVAFRYLPDPGSSVVIMIRTSTLGNSPRFFMIFLDGFFIIPLVKTKEKICAPEGFTNGLHIMI